MTSELPAKDRNPTSVRVLNSWLRDAQKLTGVAERRMNQRVKLSTDLG